MHPRIDMFLNRNFLITPKPNKDQMVNLLDKVCYCYFQVISP